VKIGDYVGLMDIGCKWCCNEDVYVVVLLFFGVVDGMGGV